MNIKKYFEWIEKENTPYQNLQNVSKVMFRWRFIFLKHFILFLFNLLGWHWLINL